MKMMFRFLVTLISCVAICACSRATQERPQSPAEIYDNCCYVAYLDSDDAVPIRDGFTFTEDQLIILGDSELGKKAIDALPVKMGEESQEAVFLFSFGIHIILDSNQVPKYLIQTSSAPYVSVSELEKRDNVWQWTSHSKQVANDLAENYYQILSGKLLEHIKDPIAKEALKSYIERAN